MNQTPTRWILSERQQVFVELVAQGVKPVVAAGVAGYDPDNLREIAYFLLQQQGIRQAIRAGLRSRVGNARP